MNHPNVLERIIDFVDNVGEVIYRNRNPLLNQLHWDYINFGRMHFFEIMSSSAAAMNP